MTTELFECIAEDSTTFIAQLIVPDNVVRLTMYELADPTGVDFCIEIPKHAVRQLIKALQAAEESL